MVLPSFHPCERATRPHLQEQPRLPCNFPSISKSRSLSPIWGLETTSLFNEFIDGGRVRVEVEKRRVEDGGHIGDRRKERGFERHCCDPFFCDLRNDTGEDEEGGRGGRGRSIAPLKGRRNGGGDDDCRLRRQERRDRRREQWSKQEKMTLSSTTWKCHSPE